MISDDRFHFCCQRFQVGIGGTSLRPAQFAMRFAMIFHAILRHITLVELLAFKRAEFFHLRLVCIVRLGRQRHTFGLGDLLQFLLCLRMIVDHLLRKSFDVVILRLFQSKIRRLDFSEIRLSHFAHDVAV